MLAHLLFTSFSASLIVEVFACKALGALFRPSWVSGITVDSTR